MSLSPNLHLVDNEKMPTEQRIKNLLSRMTIAEKIGQMSQVQSHAGWLTDELAADIKAGKIGSIINEVDLDTVNAMQYVATKESRLGIPLLIGRDVIHGFKTIFPIPLGQAASWQPDLIRQAAHVSALEAATTGVNWTFAPMIDISRDPRWGRVAESFGEDPYLTSVLGVAMSEGYQTENLANTGAIAACAKHFVGYGAAESGRDYNTTNIPENELRNVYLKPFKALADHGIATFMTAFNDLNGVPASGNDWLTQTVLREEWQYSGMVVSDWDSIKELSVHGFTANDKEAALAGFNAGINMEMASSTYQDHLLTLLGEGKISLTQIDDMVSGILKLKFDLGLFEQPFTNPEQLPELVNPQHLALAKEAAIKSCVLLKNQGQTGSKLNQPLLPLALDKLNSLAVIGPFADDGYEQLGTWIFDGEEQHSQTCLSAIKQLITDSNTDLALHVAKGVENSRTTSCDNFEQAVNCAAQSDAVVMVLGEESILSGEAHSRSTIDLPGAQEQLIEAISATGKPIVLVIMAGRPLTLGNIIDKVDAILYAWHPGSMGGPAIVDLLFGTAAPSGKLPVTFPRVLGQIPIYYNQKNTGRPVTDASCIHMNDIEARAPQTSLGMTASHLDTHYTPLFPFGFGLSYSSVEYSNLTILTPSVSLGGTVKASVEITNTGSREMEEVVQLYTRDLVASVTRPVKELKAFKTVKLAAKERQTVVFEINTDELAFYNRQMQLVTEAGDFQLWIAGDSASTSYVEFTLTEN